MESVKIGKSEIQSSRLVYGCMRIANDTDEKGKKAVRAAIEEGYTHFDHADIYGHGRCEELFGEVLRESPGLRDSLVITTKCSVKMKGEPNSSDPGRYDSSRRHIIGSVEGSLARLNVDQIDILLLHRPDYLLNAEEASGALRELKDSGRVSNFGVSNYSPSQVSLLQSRCEFPLLMNQVEINMHNIDALVDGTLDQCQELNITPQAWCPLGGVAYPAWGSTFSEDDEKRIRAEFDLQARKYSTESVIIMLAWLLKHPSVILPIIGSTTPTRIRALKGALDLDYSREDWYRLLEARNGHPVA
jgi:predicted oxidoreductase